MSVQKITNLGFLDQFLSRHQEMTNRPFCWVLGSGASVQSGIPTGGTLVMEWLKELHRMEDFTNSPLENWATSENLEIPGFDFTHSADFYPWIYQRRFRDYKEEGYAFLEEKMDHAEPSFGYSVLAQIMARTAHKIAITTNFDNLIADALSIYTRTFPLVCGHESLTGYIRPNLRRPLIAKIHRDLLLNPKSEPGEIEKLPEEWAAALRKIFERFTPIILGYGGNDGSLMGFLKNLSPIEGGLFWCFRGDHEPEEKVCEIVERHRGRLVPIAGFDEVMLQIWEKLKFTTPIPDLQKTHDQRVTAYQKQFEALNAALKKPAANIAAEEAREPARAAAAAAVERLTKEEDWWAWQLKADAEADPVKKEALYREGLNDFPKSAELTANFAIFMQEVREDDEAERLFRAALELDPYDVTHATNFALFMQDIREDYDEAERLYRSALELDSNHVNNILCFARFMETIRTNHTEAESLLRKAVELNPQNAKHTARLAFLMETIRKDYEEAERLYKKSLALDPTDEWVQQQLAELTKKHSS